MAMTILHLTAGVLKGPQTESISYLMDILYLPLSTSDLTN